jgi:hypothetical protein
MAFENGLLWNVWEPALWKPAETFLLEILKPYVILFEDDFLKKESRLSSKRWTQ